MNISVVIPHITQRPEQLAMLNECLDSFKRWHPDFLGKIIIVDDSSKAPFSDQLKSLCESSGYDYLYNSVNSGFSVTVNKGINRALDIYGADVCLVVNNDVVFTKEVISAVKSSFEMNERVGIVGALLFYPHGTIQHGGVARVGNGFTHRGWHQPIESMPSLREKEYLVAVTGAVFGMRKEMIKEIGAFREDYFIACEDVEICYRAWTANWRVLYNPEIEAIHKEGGTRGRTDSEKKAKYRFWYHKEMETYSKFMKELVRFNQAEINGKVMSSNKELPKQAVKKSDFIEFDKVLPPTVAREKNMSEKVVVFRRTGALGDVLMTTPVIREYKERNPNSKIVFLTAIPTVLCNNSDIDVIAHPTTKVSSLNASEIYDFDLAYEKNPKCNVIDAYSRVVFGKEIEDKSLRLVSLDEDFSSAMKKIPYETLPEKLAVVHMGVSWASRTWPRSKWIETITRLTSGGYTVLVIGSGSDYRPDVLPRVIDAVGKFSIFEIREVLKRSSVFVGIDSGMFHVAQTTEVPIVGMFTVANPSYRIAQRNGDTIALIPRSDCKFCLHDQNPPVTFVSCRFGTNHCLGEIDVDSVIEACERVSR